MIKIFLSMESVWIAGDNVVGALEHGCHVFVVVVSNIHIKLSLKVIVEFIKNSVNI